MQDDLISRQAALASIKNLYPDMPIVDIFGARRKWLEKYAPYFECENAVEQLPPVKQEPKTEKVIKMRDATPEERESIDKYIKSISKPTGVDFWDLEQELSGDLISRQGRYKNQNG